MNEKNSEVKKKLKNISLLWMLIFIFSGVYVLITKNPGTKWAGIIESGSTQATYLGIFFIIMGLWFLGIFLRNK